MKRAGEIVAWALILAVVVAFFAIGIVLAALPYIAGSALLRCMGLIV